MTISSVGQWFFLEFTVYVLSPYDGDEGGESARRKLQRLQAMAAAMTLDQVEAVRSFLMFVGAHGANPEWLRQFIEAAVQLVWVRQE